ncbi:hypothetical protein [Methanobrevibacter ruminantium]|uniref:hypothetical protein n=1 Tax=Methanobrevibacter ruminantium TaxID=83816 RepID=UPI0026E99C95|nr:hypothetical protein [Methanobrevibacter ruminantium]
MPYKKPLRKKGVREPLHLHFLKLCWFEIHFEDIYDEISRKKFIENFFKYDEKVGIIEKVESEYNLVWAYDKKNFDWENLDKHSIFTKYEWDSQYKIFKTDKLQDTKLTARELYERRTVKDTITNLKQEDDIDKQIERLSEEQSKDGLHHEYRIAKLHETKSNIEQRVSKRLGLDEQNLNITMDSTNDEKIELTLEEKERIQNISSKPDKETQKFLEEIGYESGL